MGNMSYCRFRNTLTDLRDCKRHVGDECADADEEAARENLIELCQEIAVDHGTVGNELDEAREALDGVIGRLADLPTCTRDLLGEELYKKVSAVMGWDDDEEDDEIEEEQDEDSNDIEGNL